VSTDTDGKLLHARSEDEPTGSTETVSSGGATVPSAGKEGILLPHQYC